MLKLVVVFYFSLARSFVTSEIDEVAKGFVFKLRMIEQKAPTFVELILVKKITRRRFYKFKNFTRLVLIQ